MTPLRYFTTATVEQLRDTITDRLDWYYAPTARLAEFPMGGVRESKIPTPGLAARLMTDPSRPFSTDGRNALAVYKALQELTPHQASMERVWVYLCHCDCPKYVAKRWLARRPDKIEEAERKVRNHFFARGNRALIRDNGLSRLWWLGSIAVDVDTDRPEKFLEILLYRQDVRSALIERPSVSMNRRVLRGIYSVMKEEWANGGRLFRRESFRSWMIRLNRRGGVVLLDALPKPALLGLLREEARNAVDDMPGR